MDISEPSNKNTYTYQTYLRNKNIFKTIQIFLSFVYFAYLLLFAYLLRTRSQDTYSILFISLLFFIIMKILGHMHRQNTNDQHKNYLTWGRGAGAELYLLQELRRQYPEYKVVPDYDTGYGNIDYIVIGEKGVFVIEVKSHKGTISYQDGIYINGKKDERGYIEQTQRNRVAVEKLLKFALDETVFVTGILEFVYGRVDTKTIHGPVQQIWIGGKGFYRYVIAKSTDRLTPKEIGTIYGVLNNTQKRKHMPKDYMH